MSKPKQYYGNVYEIDDKAVSVLVLTTDDVAEFIGDSAQYLSTAALAQIARSMTDALIGDDWAYALAEAVEANGYKVKDYA